jgi:hypothetical protein
MTDGRSFKHFMNRYYHNVSHDSLLSATRALLKFCRDHQYPEGGLVKLQACVAALEADDFRGAVMQFRAIPLGGMGCFNDWYPPVIYSGEDKDYVSEVFGGLLERCCRLMRTAAGDAASEAEKYYRLSRRAGVVASACFVTLVISVSTASMFSNSSGHRLDWVGILCGTSFLATVASGLVCLASAILGPFKSPRPIKSDQFA